MGEKSGAGGYRWLALALLALAFFLLQGVRQVYNATLPQIRLDFADAGVSNAQLGMVGTAFLLCYGIVVPFAGIAADLLRRKWVIVAGVTLFSVGVFASGFAAGLGLFFVAFGLLNGVGQCMVPSSSTSIIAQLHPETRATALSLYQMALFAGMMACSVLAGWLGGLGPGGWRWAFWFLGGAGGVVLVLLVVFLRDTPQPVTGGREKAGFGEAVAAMTRKPSALLMTLAFGAVVFGVNGFRTWMPFHLQQTAGLDPAAAAFHAVFWFHLAAFVGIFLASRFSDRLAWNRKGIRLDVNALGLIGCIVPVTLVVRMDSLLATCIVMVVYGFMHGVYDANYFAALYDVVAPRYRAAATGLFCCGAFLMGCASPAVMGLLGVRTGFVLIGAVYAVGALATGVARLVFLTRDYVESGKDAT